MSKITIYTIVIASIPFRPSVALDVEVTLGKQTVLTLVPVPVVVKIKNLTSEKVAIKAINLSKGLTRSMRQEGLYFYLKSSSGTRWIGQPVGNVDLEYQVFIEPKPRYLDILPGSDLIVRCNLAMDWVLGDPLFEKPGEYQIYCRLIYGDQESVSNTVSLTVVEPEAEADRKALKILDRHVLQCLYMPEYIMRVENTREIIKKVLEVYDLNPSTEYKNACETGLRLWKQIEMARRKDGLDSLRGWGTISELDDRDFGEPPSTKQSTEPEEVETKIEEPKKITIPVPVLIDVLKVLDHYFEGIKGRDVKRCLESLGKDAKGLGVQGAEEIGKKLKKDFEAPSSKNIEWKSLVFRFVSCEGVLGPGMLGVKVEIEKLSVKPFAISMFAFTLTREGSAWKIFAIEDTPPRPPDAPPAKGR
jgi:hypothetical protein